MPATLWVERGDKGWVKFAVVIEDGTEFGVGLVLSEGLAAGTQILLEGGNVAASSSGRPKGFVAWCAPIGEGRFRAGISLDGAPPDNKSEEFEDFYEVLEVNPAATQDTIHKIYRLLAYRLHPDNPESGNEELFKRLNRAYKVISDPERRAAFDIDRTRRQSKQWRVFDAESAVPGLEQEKRKRRGVLSLLYVKRMRQPDQPGVGIPEMEQLLAVPREHLEFPLWFMREMGWVTRADNGKFSITGRGVEYAELSGDWKPPVAAPFGLLT